MRNGRRKKKEKEVRGRQKGHQVSLPDLWTLEIVLNTKGFLDVLQQAPLTLYLEVFSGLEWVRMSKNKCPGAALVDGHLLGAAD